MHAVGGVDVRAEVVIVWAGVGNDVGAGLCAVRGGRSSVLVELRNLPRNVAAMAYCPLMWILFIQS